MKSKGDPTAKQTAAAEHTALCHRLMVLLPCIAKGMRRSQDSTAPPSAAPLGPRHHEVLQQLREQPMTVGALAGSLGLTLPTVSGVVSELDRAGYLERSSDEIDRRRTVVRFARGKEADIAIWLDGAAKPVARVLDQLVPAEQTAFLKALNLLEVELRPQRRRSGRGGTFPEEGLAKLGKVRVGRGRKSAIARDTIDEIVD